MKQAYKVLGLVVLGLSSAAFAQQPAGEWSWYGSLGLTFGGDELATVDFVDADDESVEAGGLIYFSFGRAYTHDNVELQATLGYHFDNVSAKNGDVSFTRFPVDVLVFHKQEKFRIGGGVTYHLNPTLDVDFSGGGKVDFDNALGFVIQADYLFDAANIGIRFVNIDYEIDEIGGEIDGGHVGIVVGSKF